VRTKRSSEKAADAQVYFGAQTGFRLAHEVSVHGVDAPERVGPEGHECYGVLLSRAAAAAVTAAPGCFVRQKDQTQHAAGQSSGHVFRAVIDNDSAGETGGGGWGVGWHSARRKGI